MYKRQSSPMARTFSLQRRKNSGARPMSIGQMTKPRSFHSMPERLPMSQ